MAETAKGIRYTTKHIWELEREALATAERMAKEPRGEAGELVAARVIAFSSVTQSAAAAP